MRWASQLRTVLLFVLSVALAEIFPFICDSNDDCLPYGCCLANFVGDEEATCEVLGKSGDPCDTTLSVSVPASEGEEVHANNKYLGHCPCGEGLVCTKEENTSHCDPGDYNN